MEVLLPACTRRPARPPWRRVPERAALCRGGPACPPLLPPVVEQAARLATPASPWSAQSCVPHRQPCAGGWLLVLSSPPPLCRFLLWCAVFSWGRLFLWGRLSSLRPAFQPAWAPFTHCSQPNRVRPRWSEPPGFPPRPLRGARSLACHTGSPVPVVGLWPFPLLRPCAGFSFSTSP